MHDLQNKITLVLVYAVPEFILLLLHTGCLYLAITQTVMKKNTLSLSLTLSSRNAFIRWICICCGYSICASMFLPIIFVFNVLLFCLLIDFLTLITIDGSLIQTPFWEGVFGTEDNKETNDIGYKKLWNLMDTLCYYLVNDVACYRIDNQSIETFINKLVVLIMNR